ncbi:MAG: tetratricopeptide repeat protein, partial [Myxococcota bacterium]
MLWCLAALALSACGSNASNASRDAEAALASATPPEEIADAPSAEELMQEAAPPRPEGSAKADELNRTAPQEGADQAKAKEPEGKAPKAELLEAESRVSDALGRRVSSAINDAQGGKLEDAVSALEKLVEEPEGGYLAAYNLGVLRERQGKYDRAAEAYVKCLGQNPSFSPALHNVVRIYLRKGATRDARSVAVEFSERRPQVLGHR